MRLTTGDVGSPLPKTFQQAEPDAVQLETLFAINTPASVAT
jgi:hypothetical protein